MKPGRPRTLSCLYATPVVSHPNGMADTHFFRILTFLSQSLTFGFYESGDTYLPSPAWVPEIESVYRNYLDDEKETFVHLFNMTGVLQHNDIGPQWHPTDVGHVKVASHLLQYVRMKFGYDLEAVGPEIQHDTLYWNNQENY